ncbi:MAG: sulfotransferase domain-containing protein [Bradymonadaceae bacterium]
MTDDVSGENKRPQPVIWLDALQRAAMRYLLSDRLPLYLVPEYPKSGASWFSQMLSDALGVPFPRNERPRIESCILHGHFLYHPRFENAFCVMRDGRDIAVSAYFHYLQHNDKNHPRMVERHRSNVPFDDYEAVRENMPAFIEYLFTGDPNLIRNFSWDEFVRSYLGREDVYIVRYEELLEDAAGTLKEAVSEVLGIELALDRLEAIEEKYSFENVAGREPGEEDTSSFARKGVAGDWKNKFTPRAAEVFDSFAGEELVRLGYEEDRDWVDRVRDELVDRGESGGR